MKVAFFSAFLFLKERFMATYMVSINWSGALNIGDMRTFPTQEQCWEYSKSLTSCGTIKVYELFSNKEPRLCKLPKAPKTKK